MMVGGHSFTKQRCGDFIRRADARVQLLVLMVSIGAGTLGSNEVRFDLTWHYPPGQRRFCDATCFIYDKDRKPVSPRWVNFHNSVGDGIFHFGDYVDDAAGIGRQSIILTIAGLRENYHRLFFTLSAVAPEATLGASTPEVQLFNSSSSDGRNLCPPYQLSNAAGSQALVLCFLRRTEGGRWAVQQGGVLSAGSSAHAQYKPLMKTLETTDAFWV
jgi:hypothetical protein